MLTYLSLLTALPVLLSPWFSLLVVFAPVSSSFFLLGLLLLAFRTLYSLLGWSVFASSSAVVLSLLLGLPFSFLCVSPFSAFLQEFLLPFATSSVYPSFVCQTVCRYIRLPLFFIPFASFASGLSCFTYASFALFEFLVGFFVLYRLPLRFFHLRVPMVFPYWYGHSFQLPLLRFMGLFILLLSYASV